MNDQKFPQGTLETSHQRQLSQKDVRLARLGAIVELWAEEEAATGPKSGHSPADHCLMPRTTSLIDGGAEEDWKAGRLLVMLSLPAEACSTACKQIGCLSSKSIGLTCGSGQGHAPMCQQSVTMCHDESCT